MRPKTFKFRIFFENWRITNSAHSKNYNLGGINLDTIALILVIIGALNWGSIGIFGVDAIGALLGGQLSVISRIIYTIVALAGIWSITLLFRDKHVVGSDTDS